MSHVAVQTTKPGEPMFADLEALRLACTQLGLELVRQNTYHWFGRSVGDYPTPPGMKKEELGKNAEYVIKLGPERAAAARGKYGGPPYEIGLVPDANNPGAYVPVFDYWMGGYGLCDATGRPARDGTGAVTCLCPKMKQHYDMCCDGLAAQAAGDAVEFLTLQDASQKYPDQFEASKDSETWVSIVDTSARLGV